MTLRIVENIGLSDVGRQRSSNEDSYVVATPFFAVADGMGGAKAGEVASEIAAKAFDEDPEASAPPERRLTAIARAANARIHELSRRDESRRGMGTTLTAAMVIDGEVSIAHVGDSRAYRIRDGELEQLTHDHSLVAELERTGQISAEEAEHHPQRSIITRALGPEPEVEVDTYTHHGRPGDIYLLCSDGLTGMVSDQELASIVRQAPSLQDAAESLVRAANQSGGKDNITVVLFRVDEGDDGAVAPPADETLVGQLSAEDVRAAPGPPRATAAEVAAAPRERRPREPEPASRSAAPRSRSRLRRGVGILAMLLVIGGVGIGLYLGGRQVYFVGTDESGLVTLYRGLPYELPLGVRLYSRQYQSSVPAGSMPAARRQRVLDHEWRGRADARDLVRQLERRRLGGRR